MHTCELKIWHNKEINQDKEMIQDKEGPVLNHVGIPANLLDK